MIQDSDAINTVPEMTVSSDSSMETLPATFSAAPEAAGSKDLLELNVPPASVDTMAIPMPQTLHESTSEDTGILVEPDILILSELSALPYNVINEVSTLTTNDAINEVTILTTNNATDFHTLTANDPINVPTSNVTISENLPVQSSAGMSVEDIVRKTVHQCTTTGLDSNPVEVLRLYQNNFVIGRPLEIINPCEVTVGITNPIFVDRYNILEAGFDEIRAIENKRITLEFYNEVRLPNSIYAIYIPLERVLAKD